MRAEDVTAEWLMAEMKRTGMRVKELSRLTSVSANLISRHRTGCQAMSAASKAMYFWFFKTQQNEITK